MIKNYLLNHSHRYASKWLVLAIDVATVNIAFLLSYIIKFNLTMRFEVDQLFFQLPIISVIAAVAFMFTSSFKGVVRHTGVRDVYNICLLYTSDAADE